MGDADLFEESGSRNGWIRYERTLAGEAERSRAETSRETKMEFHRQQQPVATMAAATAVGGNGLTERRSLWQIRASRGPRGSPNMTSFGCRVYG